LAEIFRSYAVKEIRKKDRYGNEGFETVLDYMLNRSVGKLA
jgi:hypothetical protein